MPNKYSHAIVLSNYEAYGLTEFDRGPSSTRPRSVKSATSANSARSTKSAPQPRGHREPLPAHPSLPLHSTDRIRLEDTPIPPRPNTSHVPQHRIHEPVDTHIPSRQQMSPQQPTLEQRRRFAYPSLDYDLYEPRSSPRPTGQDGPPIRKKQESAKQRIPSPIHTSGHRVTPSAETLEIAIDDPEWLQATRMRRRRLTNDTAIWDPQPAPPSSKPQVAQSARPMPHLVPQHPMTPPLTPKTKNSWESFSLETQLDNIPLATSLAPPIPDRSPCRSPTQATSKDPDAAISALCLNPTPPPSRPKTSSGPPRPLSISARRSSLNATRSGRPASVSSHRSEGSFTLSSANSPIFFERPPSLDLDSDLEPLPPDLINDPEFCDLPWDACEIPPNILRLQREGRALSMASSFDSAAPPPISTGRSPNHRIPAFLNERPAQTKPSVKSKESNPKKVKSSFSFLGVGRPSTPKAVLYSTTTPGKPPIPVSVSRTAAPSIPALFSKYRGPFPPPAAAPEPHSSISAATRATAHIRDPYILIEQRRTAVGASANSGNYDNGSSRRSRRSSLLSTQAATEKRLSWFKTEPLDRVLGFAEVGKKSVVGNMKDSGVL